LFVVQGIDQFIGPHAPVGFAAMGDIADVNAVGEHLVKCSPAEVSVTVIAAVLQDPGLGSDTLDCQLLL
jgi:hypothetical protein